MKPVLIYDHIVTRDTFVSTNKFYAGKHYSFRTKVKEEFSWMYYAATKNLSEFKSIDPPYNLHFIFTFSKRPFDASNCSVMAKMIEDSLVSDRTINNDSCNIVQSVTYEARKAKEDRIKIYLSKHIDID